MSTDYFPGLHMSIDHHGQHPGDSELALDTTETTILDTFIRALALHTFSDMDNADNGIRTKDPS
ncbi:hypothetical protein I1A62_00220 (plasmid) [Rhodococcus sp. USK10]|uniref:hypothetical protein n=1 Tax=Rhodococcus sp. USK10 TaxID=2789739 RepID=UPI001C5F2AEA|nr:hypothetical protein [Rhodococcus sp. USK10]QYA99688.1 hypothetical protein I1A62_00220 [Rhodococcus sp. USK10]